MHACPISYTGNRVAVHSCRLPLILAYLARQPLQSFWTAYCSALDTYPLLIKIATGEVLSAQPRWYLPMSGAAQ